MKYQKKVNERITNKNDIATYYDVGKLLSDAGKHYGEAVIKQYSEKLINDIGKKYDISSLKRMRKFYLIIEQGVLFSQQISWSHYQELLPIKDINEINYYIDVSVNEHLSRNELRSRIKRQEYQRLTMKRKIN